MTKPPSARVFAAIYACSERSIRNYRAEGAPLDDPSAMFAWWASRKNMPRSTAAKGLEAVQAAYTDVVGKAAPPAGDVAEVVLDSSTAMNVPGDLPAGAQHELRWLEALAVEARHNLIRAKQSNNPVTIKQSLDAYLKITEGLRKFDNQVDQSRRDGGEVVTKAQIQSVLCGVIAWVRRGIEDYLNGICLTIAECDTPQEVYAAIAEPLRGSLARAVDASMESQTKTPGWVRDSMVEGL